MQKYQKGGYKEWDKKTIRKSLGDLGLNNLTTIWATDSIDEVTEIFIVEKLRCLVAKSDVYCTRTTTIAI